MSTNSRTRIQDSYLAPEHETLCALAETAGLSEDDRTAISRNATALVKNIRQQGEPTMMESFLGEYGLSTKEGVALMCLAEALLRVPDTHTMDALISDKIAPSRWAQHLGHSSSPLVNASTWGLLLTGSLVHHDEAGVAGVLHGIIRRLGEPVVRTAVGRAMKELGRQFVLGSTIQEAMERAVRLEATGCTYSYDMLGEAAMTEAHAGRYHLSYSNAISALAAACTHDDIRHNPGISVKFSALHPRYETVKRERVMAELVPRVTALAMQAKSANMGFNVDAEEAGRLELSLDVIEAVLSSPALSGWHGFGVVVQAYSRRAAAVLDWLYELARRLDRRIMVRLVKGAYWDTEIKLAQTLGLDDYPVFTRKTGTDVSYIACAKKLLQMGDRIYAQFATHNAHTVSAVLHLAKARDKTGAGFEFQRLHGMGESLHQAVRQQHGIPCRIYAPVGAHRDLLAYLVRRLLENGANSSFVNQIIDDRVPAEEVARDPFAAFAALDGDGAGEGDRDGDGGEGQYTANPYIPLPPALYGANRLNARGRDIMDPASLNRIMAKRRSFETRIWRCGPMIAGAVRGGPLQHHYNPAYASDLTGYCIESTPRDVETALAAAAGGFEVWSAQSDRQRRTILNRVGDLYEQHAEEFFALAAREAGKTLADCIGEVREAVDFIRYYANEGVRLADRNEGPLYESMGVFVCISPWNFPLAIFTGQIAAALAAGNAVIAKPADQTPLIAARAVALMHEAGIPKASLQLLPGSGPAVGQPLVSDPRVSGVCFTGSTATARRINQAMAEHLAPGAPLLAETGGLNAMIVDSTALPEQAVRDIVTSAFQSAGQRCSALRVLYLQTDIEERFLDMLYGAMDELALGNPLNFAVDTGPVIDKAAKQKIDAHCEHFQKKGRLLKRLDLPQTDSDDFTGGFRHNIRGGIFAAPAVIKLDSIGELSEEIFGPVLHVVSFEAHEIEAVVDAINASGYGLTFGLHTRVDSRVQQVIDRIRVGNIYVNRNQIGAVVGSQPFGGEGLSGTGPKAGGPGYVARFMVRQALDNTDSMEAPRSQTMDPERLQQAIDDVTALAAAGSSTLASAPDSAPVTTMPGPTGESNRLSLHPRGVVLCLGADPALLQAQVLQALSGGNGVVVVSPQIPARLDELVQSGSPLVVLPGQLDMAALATLNGFHAVACVTNEAILRKIRRVLAGREGAIIPLITEHHAPERYVLERHVCIDTTASGGNAALLSLSDQQG